MQSFIGGPKPARRASTSEQVLARSSSARKFAGWFHSANLKHSMSALGMRYSLTEAQRSIRIGEAAFLINFTGQLLTRMI